MHAHAQSYEAVHTHIQTQCIRFGFLDAASTEILTFKLEFVTGGVELLRAILHGYAGGLIFMK